MSPGLAQGWAPLAFAEGVLGALKTGNRAKGCRLVLRDWPELWCDPKLSRRQTVGLCPPLLPFPSSKAQWKMPLPSGGLP